MELDTTVAERAITEALKLGASYVDTRLEDSKWESVVIKDGKVERVKSGEQYGIGLRVFLKTWGFASTTDTGKNALKETVASAVGMARSAKKVDKMRFSKNTVKKDIVRTVVAENPLDVPVEEKVSLCLESDKLARTDKFIKRTAAWMSGEVSMKKFLSSEGADITFENALTYCEVFALAKRGNVVEYVDELAGGTGGYEIVKKFEMTSKAAEVGKRASKLAASKPLPEKKTAVILDQDLVSLLCHEIIGHPSEADRVLGREAAWAGKAWWAGMIGKKVGSELLSATDDPRVKGALGYYEYDDEGTRAQHKELIRHGVLTEHMHSRETAAEFGVSPNGNMRAQSFKYLPLIRMSNTFVEAGDFNKDELFDVSKGVYLKGQKVPSIDSKRYNFQLSAKEGFLISHGELEGPFRAASISGIAPEFFNSIDAVADDFEMRPVPNCGKGDPMQTIQVGNGGPHIRGVGLVSGAR